jgi:hypothetical protein
MPNSTCRLLSNGYKFDISWSGDVNYKPCCHYPESQNTDAPIEVHQMFRNKLNLVNSYETGNCYKCNSDTRKKLKKTWRDHSFDIVPEDAKLGDASYLEIQTNKVCNGGCIICGPVNSSYWQNEIKIFPTKPIGDPIDKILSQIDIQKTRKILFLGGEPFLSDDDIRILPLIEHPELVDLQYTTNCSIYPSDAHISLWKNFKSVLINFSLDGIGSRFDYIRYPLKWNQVEKNVTRMMQNLPSNVKFKSNHVVNILNLYYYDEFEEWHDLVMTGCELTFTTCDGLLNPLAVPDKLFNMLLDKYHPDSKVIRLVRDADSQNQSDMLDYLSELDQRRNQNWQLIFPEISNCFKRN